MQIGILGGTGPAGSALAVRLASVGHDVVLGSRSRYRAMEVVDKLLDAWPDRTLPVVAGDSLYCSVGSLGGTSVRFVA